MSEGKLVLKIDNTTSLIFTEHGVYEHIEIPKNIQKEKKHSFALPCQVLCGKNLKRPHWSCSYCRLRKVWLGELPPTFPVTVLLFMVLKKRRFATIKNFLIKQLSRLMELLAN